MGSNNHDEDVAMGSPPGTPTSSSNNCDDADGVEQSIYHLPDGTPIDLSSSFGRDLSQLPELLFTEIAALPFQQQQNNLASSSLSSTSTLSNAPIHKLVHESLLATGDVDVRKELAG